MNEQPVETTLYSLVDAPPPPPALQPDRRGDERHMTLLRVGSVTIGDRRELCLIRNVSAGGMMIRAYCAIPEGTRVAIELKVGRPVTGTACWNQGAIVGIRFDEPIDVVALLAASMEGPRPRMPRVEVHCVVSVREGANVYRVLARDVSQGGIKIQTETVLPVQGDVVVSLPGMDPQAGVVRWSQGGCAGITFNRLLPLPELVAWLHAQREGLRAAS